MTTFLNFGGGGKPAIQKLGVLQFYRSGYTPSNPTLTLDVKPLYSKWSALTINDFFPINEFYFKEHRSESGAVISAGIQNSTMSYNASTGILSVTANFQNWGNKGVDFWANLPIYIIKSGGGN